MAAPRSTFRVLEFYSGIGGMHCAVRESCLDATVVAAIDINDLANRVYSHNFPHVNLMQRNIQSVTLGKFNELDADVFLMSPPCQPFTRVGLKGDIKDPRTQSFFHLLDILPKLAKPPNYILVENVQGFETSHTRNHLVKKLEQCNYAYQEFLLSPTQFGIPNQRLRYFLLAKRRPLVFSPANLLQLERRTLQTQQLCSNRVVAFGCRMAAESTECFTDAVDSLSHLEIDESTGKCCCDIVDASSRTQSCKCEARESKTTSCREGSCSNGITNRAPSCGHRAGSVSALLKTEACSKESSWEEITNEEHSSHKDGHLDSIDSREEDSSARVGAIATHPPIEDRLRDVAIVSCEYTSAKHLEQGRIDEISHCTTDQSCLTAQNSHSTLPPKHSKNSTSLRSNNLEKEPQVSCKNVADYLENLPEEEVEHLLLPDRLLKRFARIVDVVTATECNTRCFTKAYGHYVEGTGSMLQMNATTNGTPVLKNCPKDTESVTAEYLEQLKCLRIRYFTPREIANLHHLPELFDFPAELTRKQRYRCLGNSLNVHVVSVLLRYMVTECAH